MTSVSSSISTTNYSAYDALGRITSANQATDSQTYTMSYAYNLASGQTSMTYPSGRVILTGYDDAGRLAGVRDQSSGVYYAGAASTDATNRIQYAPQGAVSLMKLGNGLWEHTNFNSRLQPSEIGLGTSSTSTSVVGLTYNHGTTNNNGNVQSLSYSGGGLSYTQSFGYDALNRLTTSNENSGSSWSETNGYDRYGNRWIDLGGGNQSLYFNSSNNRITNSGYAYDSAGNVTNDTLHTYGFDAENKIKTVDGVSDVYRYDGDGNRVRKNFSSGEKVRTVYSRGQLIAEYDLSNGALKKEYVYGAKGLIATIEPTNGTRYTTSDHLGSPRVVTNSSAGVVSRHDYMPFGVELGVGIGGRTTGMGFSVTDGLRQKFTQKERDNETGLDYFGARYYGSTQGRFTSTDPLFSSGRPEMPQSWNRYAYVLNNPLFFIDPDGKKEKPFDSQKDKPFDRQKAQKGATPVQKRDKRTGEPMVDPTSGLAIGNEKAYNCHSYAWHDKKGDPTDPRNANLVAGGVTKWDNSPSDDMGGHRQMPSDEANKKGDRVLYYVDANNDGKYSEGEQIEHSALVSKVDKEGNTTRVKGKPGELGVYENHPGAPTYYDRTAEGTEVKRAYFRKEKQ